MKDRIAHIMRAKNLKASDLAALLGIQPSGVSHILAGRNNPSLEFVKKIKETFPEYNLDWIIFGTGPMTLSEPYREAFKDAIQEAVSASTSVSLEDLNPDKPVVAGTSGSLFDDEDYSHAEAPTPPSPPSQVPSVQLPAIDAIKSMVVLYEDGTFETFVPR